jgi:hypothetical protein
MNAKSRARLKREIESWAEEMRTLLGACRLLIGQFGTTVELERWDTAVEATLARVRNVVGSARAQRRGERAFLPSSESATFRCSEATARIISPLVEIVGGPVAGFVYTVRRIVPKGEQNRYIRPYGDFSISFADAVTQPLWTAYRRLAPAEWKAVFPLRPRKRTARLSAAS